MLKEVSCHNGKCWEVNENKEKRIFNELFEENNIVESIEKDLWSDMF